MTQQPINLKKIEKTAFLTYFQDGLWDISIGLLVLAAFINAVIGDDNDARLIWLMLPATVVLLLGKIFITRPRMGYVEFSRKRVMKLGLAAVIFSVVFLFGAFRSILGKLEGDLPGWMEWIKTGTHGIWGSIYILAIFSIIAFLVGFSRLHYIGLMFAVAATPTRALFPNTVKFFIVTAVILVPGVYLLVRFLRRYPKSKEDEGGSNGQQ